MRMSASQSSPYRLENVRSAIGHYLLGRGAGAVIGLATAVLLVRHMDVAAYAGYTALLGLAGISGMLAALGLERALTRYIPEGRLYQTPKALSRFIWKIVLTRLAAASAAAFLLWVTWKWLVSLFEFVTLPAMPISLAVFLIANSAFSLLSTALQSLVLQKLLTRISVVLWTCRLAAILLFVHEFAVLTLDQALWVMALPELAGALILMAAIHSALRQREVAVVEGVQQASVPWPMCGEVKNLAGHAYTFNMLASLPQGYFMRTLVAATLPVDIVAAYGFFSSLIDKLRMYLPMQLMYNLAEPVLVARYLRENDEQELSRHTGLMYKANLLVLMMVLVFLLIGGGPAVGFIISGKYIEQAWLLTLLVMQVAVGSHVVAIQLIANVLKCNKILSIAGGIALAIMLAFIGGVLACEKPVLLLLGALIYDVTSNTIAILLLIRQRATYQPPFSASTKLLFTGIVLVLTANYSSSVIDVAHKSIQLITLGCVSSALLPFIAFKLNYLDKQELILLLNLFQGTRSHIK